MRGDDCHGYHQDTPGPVSNGLGQRVAQQVQGWERVDDLTVVGAAHRAPADDPVQDRQSVRSLGPRLLVLASEAGGTSVGLSGEGVHSDALASRR